MKEGSEKEQNPKLRIVGGTDVPEKKQEAEKEKIDYGAMVEALGYMKRGGSERAEGVEDIPHNESSEDRKERPEDEKE